MLVLSRKKGETIVIQDHIELTVLGVEGETVRIGIKAPREVDVFRKEVYLAIQESNRESAMPPASDFERLMQQVRMKMSGNEPKQSE